VAGRADHEVHPIRGGLFHVRKIPKQGRLRRRLAGRLSLDERGLFIDEGILLNQEGRQEPEQESRNLSFEGRRQPRDQNDTTQEKTGGGILLGSPRVNSEECIDADSSPELRRQPD
jgi:hypothetical protein